MMPNINRSSSGCRSMSLLFVLCLVVVCVAPESQTERFRRSYQDQINGALTEEKQSLCHQTGCYAVFFEKKIFREAGMACRERGGTLATLPTHEAASFVHQLLRKINVPESKSRLRLWIGLHRAPRQCSSTRPLRGFVWVTGKQDGEFTNWMRDEVPRTCTFPRCVAMSVHSSENGDDGSENFRWAEGPCQLSLSGYICQYNYKEMCPPLKDEGWGKAVYTTPFKLTSTHLDYVPFGSVASFSCQQATLSPLDAIEETVLCHKRDDGSVGWSKDPPLCSSISPPLLTDWCDIGHGCEQHCQTTYSGYFCYCSEGFVLDSDGYSCKPATHSQTDPPEQPFGPAVLAEQPQNKRVCEEMGCEFDCTETPRTIRCTCPPGYHIGPDGRKCLDVDECQQQPCSQLCINTPGTFHCTCFQGYQPDNEGECVDVDECLDDGSCGSLCENTVGSFTCQCDIGFKVTTEGKCVDVDECETDTQCEQLCLNYLGGYQCDCFMDYNLQSDGITCQPSNYDGEYSTLTPGLGSNDFPWSTPESYFEDESTFGIDWSTNVPEVLTPDRSQSDYHPDQRIDMTPRQYLTAPSPTQRQQEGNEIQENAQTIGNKPNGSSRGTGKVLVPYMDSPEDNKGSAKVITGTSDGNRKHDKSWLLVALLVPLCVFLVVMLALGIVYCTSCAVDKSLRFSDCYRWVLPNTPPDRRGGKTQA